MARNRLQESGVPQSYANPSVPQQQGYDNPYAQAAGGGGTQYPPGRNGQYSPVMNAYGQQDQYSAGGNDFWSEQTATTAKLNDLEAKIQAVRNAHQQSLNSTDPNAAAHADQLAEEARVAREHCAAAIKNLTKLAKGNKQQKGQAEASNLRFRNLLQEHQTIEKEYRQKTRDRVERQFKIVKPDASPQEIKDVVESGNAQVFSQAMLNSDRYTTARGAYREVQERQVEIAKIERTMAELAQMFQDMSMLVQQQDDAIHNVEAQTMQVSTDVNAGNHELDGAIAKAKAARKKKWICFAICVVIIAALALGLGIHFGTQNK